MKKRTNKSRIKARTLVLGLKVFAGIVAAGVLGAGIYLVAASGLFTLEKVEIGGNRHLSNQELMSLMRIKGEENLLFLSSERIYDRLHSSPWIRRVNIRKSLPDKLVVMIKESEPQAILRRPDGMVIVDIEGIELERIHGRPERFLPLITVSDSKGTKELAEALRLAAVLNDAGIAKRARSVDIGGLDGDVKDMTVRIDGMEVKVGGGSYEKKLSRLIDLIDEIKKRPIKVDYIDLRFANRVIVKPVAEVIQ